MLIEFCNRKRNNVDDIIYNFFKTYHIILIKFDIAKHINFLTVLH